MRLVSMAIYHFSAKIISRSRGRSATAAAAYRAGLDIADERTGEHHQYANRTGVLDHTILTPGRAPEWAKDSARLWNAVEQFEKRKDAQLCREIVVALPHELSLEQNRALLHGYVQAAYVKRGMAAQIDIHAPDHGGDNRNLHAHIMLTTRQVTRNGFKEKKARSWNTKETLVTWRKEWADHVNKALERAGQKERVDHRSFKDLGIEAREPTRHLGPQATQMERRGQETRIGNENRDAQAFNKLNEQAKVIDLQIEKEKRRLATPSMQQAYKRAAGRKERVSKAHAEVERQKIANDNRLSPEEAQQRRDEQRLRHLDQTRDLEGRQDREKEEYWQELRAHYGPDDRKARFELEEIRLRQRQSGLRGWVYRLGSKAGEDRVRAVEINKGLKDSKIKQALHMQNMERRQEDERAALARKQGDERYRLEWELRKAMRPERTAQREEERKREVDYDRDRGRGRERGFDFER